MIVLAAKVLLGTALYVAVLWEARRNPRAAGMMLTFPTLNGISMLMTQPADLEPIVASMLLMPIVNGLFCAIYLAAFERAVRAGQAPAASSARLLTVIAGLWFVIAWLITRRLWGIPAANQIAYLSAAGVGGFALTWAFPARRPKAQPAVSSAPQDPPMWHNWRRVALFAAALSCVLLADKVGHSPALLGVLAALPLVAFLSLHTIASDRTRSPAARREDLAAMGNGVWLGPAVAIAFIVGFWRWLAAIANHLDGARYLVVGMLSLFVGWGLCLVAIWGCEKLLRRASSRAA
ncbi:MAG TPA: hypothetical protein VGG01_03355 [Xanthobacteraceae bacterium]|jgi:hypothetical protein